MPSQLGKYTLLRTLGTGANAKVKLAQDKENNMLYAIKIMKKARIDYKFEEMVTSEVKIMSHLNHPNIVNFMEYNQDGVDEKKNGTKIPVSYIVLELATGGELFDYVATTGRFSENVARYYFQ